MAHRRIKCPHCSKNVDVDVTHVTRSRECPSCGNLIMLQFTTKQQGSKRKALMVPTVEEEMPKDHAEGEQIEPRALVGDAFGRMVLDPSVRSTLNKLLTGVGTVLGLILMLVVADYFRWWSATGDWLAKITAEKPAPLTHPVGPDSLRSAPHTGTDHNKPDALAVLSRHADAEVLPHRPPSAADSPEAPKAATSPPAAPEPAPAIEPPTSEAERAIRVLADFLKAGTVDQRLNYIRDVTAIEPIFRAYYKQHPDAPTVFTKIEALPKSSNSAVSTFTVYLPGGQSRTAYVGRSRSGEYRVDWASFVIYSAMSWAELIQQRPTSPTFLRILAEPGLRYDGPYADATQYLCVKMSDPLNTESPPLYCYVQKRTPLGQSLSLVLRTYAGQRMPLMLKVKYPPAPESAAPDQLLLDDLVGEGWITRGT